MKKKMIGFLVVAGIAVVAVVNVNLGMQKNTLSSVALENIEALAEEGYTWYADRTDDYDSQNHCYRQCTLDGTGCAYMHNFPYNC
jgi:hypothetical protein